jgi:hypothetical protein
MLNPVLTLAFWKSQHAEEAACQHVCLCRNEDILLPDPVIRAIPATSFDLPPFDGFELVFEDTSQSFVVGYNRFDGGSVMKGWLKIVGNPVQSAALL